MKPAPMHRIKEFIEKIGHSIPSWVPLLARRMVLVTVLALIIWQIWNIGWDEVLHNLPVNPLFYVILVALYLTLPTAELLIYKHVWDIKKRQLFRTFLVKRVYNEELLGYSGELYLFKKMRGLTDKSDREIMRDVRDTNIISAIVSNSVAIVLVGILIFQGIIPLTEIIERTNTMYVLTGSIVAIILIVLIVQFRKHIFAMSIDKTVRVIWIYLTRFIIHHGLLVLQWAVVLPETPIQVWLVYISTIIVLNRIPFLPAKDLVFVWIGIQLSMSFDVASAGIAGMLIVSSALTRITNLILYSVFSHKSI